MAEEEGRVPRAGFWGLAWFLSICSLRLRCCVFCVSDSCPLSQVDSNLVGTGACTHAAIIGHDGNTWATSAGFAVAPAEGKALAAGFANSQPLAASGVKLANTKYMFLRCDGRTLQGKKGTAGIHCVKTGKAILIAVYDQPITAGKKQLFFSLSFFPAIRFFCVKAWLSSFVVVSSFASILPF